jgi:hypothetical protein
LLLELLRLRLLLLGLLGLLLLVHCRPCWDSFWI